MPMRNPFAKRPGVNTGFDPGYDENQKPGTQNINPPEFERADTIGSKSSSALSINSGKSQEPAEYKLSVVNDSGVFLQPSPPEKKGFWSRRSNPSNSSTAPSSGIGEIEPFSISRESFDSYRRSFVSFTLGRQPDEDVDAGKDISAKSPVLASESPTGRQSLDAARLPRLPRLPRSAAAERRFESQPPTAEEGFEDVGLNDDQKQPKKKGFFSKFGESNEQGAVTSTSSRFHITGRKRGQSGQGAELGNIDSPLSSGTAEVETVH